MSVNKKKINKALLICSLTCGVSIVCPNVFTANNNHSVVQANQVSRPIEVGKSFTSEKITYKIITLDNDKKIGTLQVGDGSSPITNDKAEIVIPEEVKHQGFTFKVTEIGESAFEVSEGEGGEISGSVNPVKVTIPKSVTKIQTKAFKGTTKLKEIVFDKDSQLMIIDDNAFNFSHLEKFNLPKTVVSLGKGAFDFSYLKEMLIPTDSQLRTIRDKAFASTDYLEKITIPKSVTYLGKNVFQKSKVSDITVEKGNTEYSSEDGSLYDIRKEKLIKYPISKKSAIYKAPESLKHIEADAFSYEKEGSNNLKEIVLNEGLKTIGDFAFRGLTDLEKINLPKSLSTIGKLAFYNNYELKELNLPENVTKLGKYTFFNLPNLEKLSLGSKMESLSEDFLAGEAKPKKLNLVFKNPNQQFHGNLENVTITHEVTPSNNPKVEEGGGVSVESINNKASSTEGTTKGTSKENSNHSEESNESIRPISQEDSKSDALNSLTKEVSPERDKSTDTIGENPTESSGVPVNNLKENASNDSNLDNPTIDEKAEEIDSNSETIQTEANHTITSSTIDTDLTQIGEEVPLADSSVEKTKETSQEASKVVADTKDSEQPFELKKTKAEEIQEKEGKHHTQTDINGPLSVPIESANVSKANALGDMTQNQLVEKPKNMDTDLNPNLELSDHKESKVKEAKLNHHNSQVLPQTGDSFIPMIHWILLSILGTLGSFLYLFSSKAKKK
ncbi:leucine-rich repeat protein [Streptococcus hongkongensis]